MTSEELTANYSSIVGLRPNICITKIPILKSFTDNENLYKSETVSVLKGKILDGSKILDMGAGSKNIKELVSHISVSCNYMSFDIDRNYLHDFYSIDEIRGTYDYVFIFNLLEHLTLETGLQFLTKAREVLEERGILFISVPNIWHPNHMWRCDITHITPYPYQDLYALLTYMGFHKIEIYRIYHVPRKFSLKVFIASRMKEILYKLMDLDYTKDIWMIAQKGS